MLLNLYLTVNVLMVSFVMTLSKCNYNGLVFDTKYDSATAPPFGYESVESKLKLLKIISVDDSHTTMTLVLKIYLNWKEPRIQIAGNSEEKTLLRLTEIIRLLLKVSKSQKQIDYKVPDSSKKRTKHTQDSILHNLLLRFIDLYKVNLNVIRVS